jgi:endonuclease/exonuclease/phosphatase (EEP) superfamily protein YafD
MKLVDLNIEGERHLERVLPFLRRERADVVCLQEVFEVDFPVLLEAAGGDGFFAPMSRMDHLNQYTHTARGVWGIAMFTRLAHMPFKRIFYVGNGSIVSHTHPDDDNHVLLTTTVTSGGSEFVIGTTHFTWTPDGQANAQQRDALKKLLAVLPREIVLCGDFNAPRGREMFTAFTRHLKDNVPSEVTSTLDPTYHRKGDLAYVVDTVFSTPEYLFTDVQVVDGLSDHKAIVATVSRK